MDLINGYNKGNFDNNYVLLSGYQQKGLNEFLLYNNSSDYLRSLIANTIKDEVTPIIELLQSYEDAWHTIFYYTEYDNISEVEDLLSYGVQIDPENSSPELTRIGNMQLHKILPIQNMMRGCLLNDNGDVVEYLPYNDWTGCILDGSNGQVMIEIPEHYVKFTTQSNGIMEVRMSCYPLKGFLKIKKQYVSAYEASLNRSTNTLSSVVNKTTTYRGGNNNASWDDTDKSLLGMPVTSVSRTNFRSYARNRKSGSTEWNCMTYNIQKTIYWLFVVEYATLNSQANYNESLTSDGYHQGGLGSGVTNLDGNKWSSWKSYNPFIPCGYTDSLGNRTGIKSYTMPSGYDTTTTTYVNRYRGIENPFGHIYQWTDGINIQISATSTSDVYICNDPQYFSDNSYNNYTLIGQEARTNGYVRNIIFGEYGDIIPNEIGGSSSTYFCDYHYTYIPSSGTSIRGVLFGGHANVGANAGFVFAYTDITATSAYASFGSRLCFIPENSNIINYSGYTNQFNNSQWAAINSGITASDKARLNEISENIGNNSISEMRSDIDANATALATKANVDGYYESMAVGQADNLKGQVLIPNDAAFRTSGGSEDVGEGLAHLQNVKGNTVSWNQMVKGLRVFAGAATVTNGLIHVYGNATVDQSPKLVTLSGHAYLVYLSYKSNIVATSFAIREKVTGPSTARVIDSANNVLGYIRKPSTGLSETINIVCSGYTSGDFYGYMSLFDLTLIYGAGNEPTTVEQFEADYEKWFGKPLTYEPYNAGELIPTKTTALKTTGFNQLNNGVAKVIGGKEYQITGTHTNITLDGEAVTPNSSGIFTPDHTGELTVAGYSTDTCVHFVWSGTRNGEYEPYEEHTLQLPLTTLMGKLNGAGESVVVFPNGMHKFDRIYTSGGKTYGEVGGETRAYQSGDATSATMITDGHAYTYVQLATPQVYELDDFTLPARYKVNDWGTEEQIHAEGVASVPAILNSLYAVNAVDTIRRLPQNFISQESMDNFLAQLGAAMGGSWTKSFNTTTNEFEFSFTQSASLMSVNNNEETNNEEES